MSNNDWPVGPIIRVRRATAFGGRHIRDAYAIRDAGGDYLVDGATLLRDAGDRIDDWEEVTPVPTAALKRLQDAFRGIDVIESLEPPLLEVLSHLPASKPSPLDRAVTRVKDIKGAPMVDAETLPADRLSLLLDALASVQSAARKTAPLTMVTRICVDWANLENPRRDSLEAALGRTKVLSDPGSFIVLSALVGDVTTALCDNFSPRHDLIDVAAYALARAAQIIEEEDK